MTEFDYMARRTVALLLSDLREPRTQGSKSRAAELGIGFELHESGASNIPYLPIAMLAKLRILGRTLLNEIAPAIERVMPTRSQIATDYSETQVRGRPHFAMSSRSQCKGRDGVVTVTTRRSREIAENVLFVFTLAEVAFHSHMLAESLTKEELPRDHVLASLVEQVRALNAAVLTELGRPALAALVPAVGQHLSLARAHIKAICENGFMAADEEYASMVWRLTSEAMGRRPLPLPFIDLIEWRRAYWELLIRPVQGDDLRLHTAKSEDSMFELWCYAEFAAVMAERGLRSRQRMLIRSARESPLLTIGSRYFVFYDHRRSTFRAYPNRDLPFPRVFAESRVEWLLADGDGLTKSIVIDAKYRDDDSEQRLKVLGYMMEFDVDRAIIIFRGPVKHAQYHAAEQGDSYVVCRFRRPLGGDREKTLVACSLQPQDDNSNRETLTRVLDAIGL